MIRATFMVMLFTVVFLLKFTFKSFLKGALFGFIIGIFALIVLSIFTDYDTIKLISSTKAVWWYCTLAWVIIDLTDFIAIWIIDMCYGIDEMTKKKRRHIKTLGFLLFMTIWINLNYFNLLGL